MNKYIVWNYERESKTYKQKAYLMVLNFSPNTSTYVLLSSNVLMDFLWDSKPEPSQPHNNYATAWKITVKGYHLL
jgi:hypothetical protein